MTGIGKVFRVILFPAYYLLFMSAENPKIQANQPCAHLTVSVSLIECEYPKPEISYIGSSSESQKKQAEYFGIPFHISVPKGFMCEIHVLHKKDEAQVVLKFCRWVSLQELENTPEYLRILDVRDRVEKEQNLVHSVPVLLFSDRHIQVGNAYPHDEIKIDEQKVAQTHTVIDRGHMKETKEPLEITQFSNPQTKIAHVSAINVTLQEDGEFFPGLIPALIAVTTSDKTSRSTIH